MKILVVDDESDICEILKYNLETEGYEVTTAFSAEEALELPLQEYSLILLDVMMGEMSGFQLVRRLKNDVSTARIPVIFITALDGEDNLVKGLNIGADDYIVKPLSMKEVMARVRAVLRRSSQLQQTVAAPDDNMIVFEGIALDINAKTVTCDGQKLVLTKLEFELLSFFLQHPSVFTRGPAEILPATGCDGARPHSRREHHPAAQEDRPLWQTDKDTSRLWLLF